MENGPNKCVDKLSVHNMPNDEEGPSDENQNDDDMLIMHEANTRGNFEDELADQNLGNDLLMDDILNEMDATP